jgi:hypothetical protein
VAVGVQLGWAARERSSLFKNQKDKILDKGDQRPVEKVFSRETSDTKDDHNQDENEQYAAKL